MDGISQPGVQGFTNPVPGQTVVPAGVILLGEDGDATSRPSWAIDGSFLAFRQLKQLVPEYDKFLTDNPINAPGLTPAQGSALLGARLVGRWKSVRACYSSVLSLSNMVCSISRVPPLILPHSLMIPRLQRIQTATATSHTLTPMQTLHPTSPDAPSLRTPERLLPAPILTQSIFRITLCDREFPMARKVCYTLLLLSISILTCFHQVTSQEAQSNTTTIERGLAFGVWWCISPKALRHS